MIRFGCYKKKVCADGKSHCRSHRIPALLFESFLSCEMSLRKENLICRHDLVWGHRSRSQGIYTLLLNVYLQFHLLPKFRSIEHVKTAFVPSKCGKERFYDF